MQVRVDRTREDSIRALLHSLRDDSGNSGIDKPKFDFASGVGSLDTPSELHPDDARVLIKTENYCQSIDTACSTLLSPEKPEFPFSLWNDVLPNQYIDLNNVHSHIRVATESVKLSERIPDHIPLGTTASLTPTQKIKSFGDWCYVWGRYSCAVLFVFNHRQAELDSCYKFIGWIFSTTSESQHLQFIETEAAMHQ